MSRMSVNIVGHVKVVEDEYRGVTCDQRKLS